MATDATEHFHHSSEWHVVICKECQYAVWPSQIVGHLTNKQHALPRKLALLISDEIEQWPGITPFPSEFRVPDSVTAAIDGLALYESSIKCELEAGTCKYVCRDWNTIKKHWREVHGFLPGQKRGGSGRLRKEDIESQTSQSCRHVRCQLFFVQKDHSQYFEVQSTPDTDRRGVSRDQTQETWSQVWERACSHYDETRASDISRLGETDEVNPWLRRTGWVPYLEGFSSRDILRLIKEPADDEAALLRQVDESDANVFRERVAAVIWHAVADVARISQETVSRSGVMLRFESIRTEAHQNTYHPLDPYQTRDSIARQGRYWQQIVIFLVRARQEHARQAPPFKFNRRRDRAYQRLMAAAEAVVTQGDESDPSDDSTISIGTNRVDSFALGWALGSNPRGGKVDSFALEESIPLPFSTPIFLKL